MTAKYHSCSLACISVDKLTTVLSSLRKKIPKTIEIICSMSVRPTHINLWTQDEQWLFIGLTKVYKASTSEDIC